MQHVHPEAVGNNIMADTYSILQQLKYKSTAAVQLPR